MEELKVVIGEDGLTEEKEAEAMSFLDLAEQNFNAAFEALDLELDALDAEFQANGPSSEFFDKVLDHMSAANSFFGEQMGICKSLAQLVEAVEAHEAKAAV